MNQDITLGYWHARGRGQVARLLLATCGKKWNDVTYKSPDPWFSQDKQALNLPLPNLPYLIHGDFKLTESFAIYTYIVKACGQSSLAGKTIEDEATVLSLIMTGYDIDHLLVSLFWDEKWKQKVEEALQKSKPLLMKVSKFYGEKETALDYLTISDFIFKKIAPELYQKLPFLAKVRKTVEETPLVKKYYEEHGSLPFVEDGDLKF